MEELKLQRMTRELCHELYKDWGLKKEYLHSTRQHLWNNDYFEFLVKCVWKIDKPVRIIDFGCGYGYLAQMLLPLVPQ